MNRLADKSMDDLTISRLQSLASELTLAAREAEESETRARMRELYEDLVAPSTDPLPCPASPDGLWFCTPSTIRRFVCQGCLYSPCSLSAPALSLRLPSYVSPRSMSLTTDVIAEPGGTPFLIGQHTIMAAVESLLLSLVGSLKMIWEQPQGLDNLSEPAFGESPILFGVAREGISVWLMGDRYICESLS